MRKREVLGNVRVSSAWRRKVALATLLLGMVVAVWARLPGATGPHPAARIGGVALSPQGDLKVRLEHSAQAWNATAVTVRAGGTVTHSTRELLGVWRDAGEAHAAAERGRLSRWLMRVAGSVTGRGYALELEWRPRVAPQRLADAVAAIQKQVEDAQPVDVPARSGSRGQTLNSVTASVELERALRAGNVSIELPVLAIDTSGPKHDDGGPAGERELLYAAETYYPGDRSGRSVNIERAVDALEGTVLEPGAEFSFNATVGERSYERGFAAAKELANRRVVDGIGGGVCQVAATVHAAAFLAGMEITRYQPHSRPVSYIPLGLDTMVSWPDRDLAFRNVYAFPVVIRARATDKLVRIELRGAHKPPRVEWSTQLLEQIPAREQISVDPALRPGERRVLQERIDGVLVERNRTVYWPRGVEVTTRRLRYPPTPRMVAQGPSARPRGRSTAMTVDEWSAR